MVKVEEGVENLHYLRGEVMETGLEVEAALQQIHFPILVHSAALFQNHKACQLMVLNLKQKKMWETINYVTQPMNILEKLINNLPTFPMLSIIGVSQQIVFKPQDKT